MRRNPYPERCRPRARGTSCCRRTRSPCPRRCLSCTMQRSHQLRERHPWLKAHTWGCCTVHSPRRRNARSCTTTRTLGSRPCTWGCCSSRTPWPRMITRCTMLRNPPRPARRPRLPWRMWVCCTARSPRRRSGRHRTMLRTLVGRGRIWRCRMQSIPPLHKWNRHTTRRISGFQQLLRL